jgi:hypothetical protein
VQGSALCQVRSARNKQPRAQRVGRTPSVLEDIKVLLPRRFRLLTATTCCAKSARCLVCPSRCRPCKYLSTLLPPARYLYFRADWTPSAPLKLSLFRNTPETMHSPFHVAVPAALLFLMTFVAAQVTPAPSTTAPPRPTITAVSECHPHGTMQLVTMTDYALVSELIMLDTAWLVLRSAAPMYELHVRHY